MIELEKDRIARLNREALGRACQANRYAENMNLPAPVLAEPRELTETVRRDGAGGEARESTRVPGRNDGRESQACDRESSDSRGGQNTSRMKKWRGKNKTKLAAYMRAYRAKQKPPV